MKTLFQHRWFSAALTTLAAAMLMLLVMGTLDIVILGVIFLLACIVFSYPSFLERSWQSRHLPADAVHVAASRMRKGAGYDLFGLFEIPAIYEQMKSRYAMKAGDAGAPGLFLYFYLPSWLYEIRNIGPETVYKRLAEKLKADLNDSSDIDFIAQRALPLALGFRFLVKNDYPYYEMSRWISIVSTSYFRENTWVRGVLQSPKRQFRVHAPEDNEWRTFLPFLDDTRVLAGGDTHAHDFRFNGTRRLTLQQSERIGAERVDYTERIPFGSLLTYAKKGEITLADYPEASDKLYIDRVNVLVNGSEHRRDILQQLQRSLKREFTEEDFYPLFNYGQKLRGYLPAGKAASDFVSSRGNFALYYDADRGWTLIKLETGLVLRMQEAYWGQSAADVNGLRPLTSSRATLTSGAPDSLLQFQISTGTPTRGRIFVADSMIEQKLADFAMQHGFTLMESVGSGAEGCLYRAKKENKNYYIKNPDGQLAQEEIRTVQQLKSADLVPSEIRAYTEDRVLVSPEYPPLPPLNGNTPAAVGLLARYVQKVFQQGLLCLDLTPEHVRIDPAARKLFLIDFSGYVETSRFATQARELAADRKKIEYRTPEEITNQYSDAQHYQVYLLGLLLHQMLLRNHDLPSALQKLNEGAAAYETQLNADLAVFSQAHADALRQMLAFDATRRPAMETLNSLWPMSESEEDRFWKAVQ